MINTSEDGKGIFIEREIVKEDRHKEWIEKYLGRIDERSKSIEA